MPDTLETTLSEQERLGLFGTLNPETEGTHPHLLAVIESQQAGVIITTGGTVHLPDSKKHLKGVLYTDDTKLVGLKLFHVGQQNQEGNPWSGAGYKEIQKIPPSNDHPTGDLILRVVDVNEVGRGQVPYRTRTNPALLQVVASVFPPEAQEAIHRAFQL